MIRRALATAAFAVGALLTLPSARPALAQDYAAILAQPDRSDADRKTDQTRRSELFLAFAGVTAGMRVLDVSSGGGYTMDLLARTVGPTGAVYSQDTPQGAERSKERIEARLKSPALANVVRLVRPFDDPVPAELRDLDLITLYYNYHDIAFMDVDRAKMNRALLGALKPGGILVIADHSAQPGAGVTVARSLHRIEEATLRREVEAAGFTLVGEADYLRNPEDRRDVVIFRSPVPVDAFVHRYEKPR